MCKETGLDGDDLEHMTVGMCLDFIDEYTSHKNPDKQKEKTRNATQSDYDSF